MNQSLEEFFPEHSSTSTIHLCKIVLRNFGRFENDTFEFHRGMNRIDGDNGAGKTTLLKAIMALLWATQGDSGPSLTATVGKYVVESKAREKTSIVTGFFEERDNSATVTGTHTLRVTMSKVKENIFESFQWNGILKSVSQIRKIFGEYGLNGFSVISISDEKIACLDTELAVYLQSAADKAPFINDVKKSFELLQSGVTSFMDGVELLNTHSVRARSILERIGSLTSGDDVLAHRRGAEEQAELTDLQREIHILERQAGEYRAICEKDNQEMKKKAKDLLGNLTSDSACWLADPTENGAARRTPGAILEMLKSELAKHEKIPASSEFPETAEEEEQTLKRTAEQNRQAHRENKHILIKHQITDHSLQARLRLLLEKCGTVEDYGNSAANQLNLKLEFLQRRRSVTNEERLKLEAALAEKQTLIEETLAQKNAIEQELLVKQKDNNILSESKLLKEIDLVRVEALVSSDPEFESLEAEISESLNFNHVRLIQSMRSVLESLGVEDESGWSSFGYYSMVIDHIDVESHNRALMHPVKNFLATFLVRDSETAWKMRDALRELDLEFNADFICLENYEISTEQRGIPPRCEPLSSFIEIKMYTRVPFDEGQRRKFRDIIDCELRNHFVIQQNRVAASEIAQEALGNPDWEFCTFTAQDGTCFSQDLMLMRPIGGDAITTYERLCRYLNSKQSLIDRRTEDLKRSSAAEERSRRQIETVSKLGNAKTMELDDYLIEARALSSRKEFVEKRISEIDKEISDVREQLKDLESDFSNRNRASLHSELQSQIEQLRRDIEEASAKDRDLSESVRTSTKALAASLIRATTAVGRENLVKRSEAHISQLESNIKFVESFLEKANFGVNSGQSETEDEDDGAVVGYREQEQEASFRDEINVRRYILKLKRARLEGRNAGSDGNRAGSSVRDAVGSNRQQQATRKSKKNRPASLKEDLRKKLLKATTCAPRMPLISEPCRENLARIFDCNEEESTLRDLRKNVFDILFERFQTNFRAFAPRGEVRLARGNQVDRRGLPVAPRADDLGVIEVSFDVARSEPRVPTLLSGGERTMVTFSAMLSPAALSPHCVFLFDEVDAPLDWVNQDVYSKFLNTLVDAGQIFLVSHKANPKSLRTDKRVWIEAKRKGRQCAPDTPSHS